MSSDTFTIRCLDNVGIAEEIIKMKTRNTLGSLVLAGSLAYNISPVLTQGPSSAYADYAGKATTQSRVIDAQPVTNDARITQDEWITFFNKQGKAMIDASDLYKAGQAGSDELVNSLQEALKHGIFTSTRIIYDHNTLDARIIHNYKSAVVKPTESKVAIPVYQQVTRLSKALGTKEGKAYLKALFNTNDAPENIAKTLSRLSGKGIDNIYVWTPPQNLEFGRKNVSARVVEFGYDYVCIRLLVDGGELLNSRGRSRGVSVKTDKVKQK